MEQRAVLINGLLPHYEAFQWDHDTIGRTNLVEHKIDTGNARPIAQRQYPIPTVAKRSLLEQVKDM
jgi:hypothetical protein